jgi:hypothetical protein
MGTNLTVNEQLVHITVIEDDGSSIVVSSPGPQGPPGLAGPSGGTGVVESIAPITYDGVTRTISTALSTNRLLGRFTAGSGVAEEILLGANLYFDGATLNSSGGGAVRIDTATLGTIYVGRAASGTNEGDSVWTIVRTMYSSVGLRTSKGTSTNVTWTGRTGHNYT